MPPTDRHHDGHPPRPGQPAGAFPSSPTPGPDATAAPDATDTPDPAVAREQEHLTMLLAHVDAARDRLTRRLGEVQRRTADIEDRKSVV